MNILITGGAGYVGNELVFELVKREDVDSIIIYDNLSRKNYNLFFDTPYPKGKVKFVMGELLDTRKLSNVLQNVDVVFHLAAKVSTPFASEDPHLFEQINHWGTAELVYAVENSNVKKFIYTSSTSVYGESDTFIDINTIPNPKTFYGTSKLRGEEHVKRLFNKLDAFIIRCGNIYGYSPSLRFDAVINRFMFEANFNGRIQISGNGKQHRAFIHIDRLVNALINLLSSDLKPDTYNLVDKNLSVLEITEVIKEVYPDLEMLFINQHLTMRELKVKIDDRINMIISSQEISFKEELIEFKKRFAFFTESI